MAASLFFRPATAADEVVVAGHTRRAAIEATQYRGALADIVTKGQECCFVSGVGHTILGSIIVDRESTEVAHIQRVYVDPAAREIGLGDTMMSGVLAWLSETGCTWVSGVALPGDRQTKNLFERHGLVAQSITVGKRINDPSIEGHASR